MNIRQLERTSKTRVRGRAVLESSKKNPASKGGKKPAREPPKRKKEEGSSRSKDINLKGVSHLM